MMQFTQIGPGRCLGNHFDRRDNWREGIASIAWGEAASPADARGDSWTLCMQQSAEQLGKVAKEVKLQLPPGSAYVLTGPAQGRTAWCAKQAVAHQACTCCWTHGIWNRDSTQKRHSITLRAYDVDWGRHGEEERATD